MKIKVHCDKKNFKIFLIARKSQYKSFQRLIFEDIDRSERINIEILINSEIACTITCYSRADFERMYRSIKKYIE